MDGEKDRAYLPVYECVFSRTIHSWANQPTGCVVAPMKNGCVRELDVCVLAWRREPFSRWEAVWCIPCRAPKRLQEPHT